MKTMEKTNPLPIGTSGEKNSNLYWSPLEAFYSGLAIRRGYSKFKMEERNCENDG